MRRAILSAASVGALLAAPVAEGETWSVLAGRLTDAETGQTRPLSGELEASPLPVQLGGASDFRYLHVDDFALGAGDRTLTPAGPVQDPRLGPLAWATLADQVLVEGERVTMLWLRAGGDLVSESDDQLTFRFVDLRADASDGGRAIGRLGDSDLPRRLELFGTLVEVLQSFVAPDDGCSQPSLPIGGSPGGGGVVVRDGGAIISYPSFDIGAYGDVTLFQQPSTGAVLNRVTGQPASIGGSLQSGGSVYLLNPTGVVYSSSYQASPQSVATSASVSIFVQPVSAEPTSTPTLEELGIRAPDGAEVTLDPEGALVVTSEGDLFVEGTLPEIEIPGLTSVTLTTSGDISVTGVIQLPSDVSLSLNAGGQVAVPGSIEGPAVISPAFCGLRPMAPEERVLGSFSLVATAAQPVGVDVRRGRARGPLRPGSRQLIPVALLGSPDLDVRDVDPGSLRLGDGEAEPLSPRGVPLILRTRANRDRQADLVGFFRVRDAEVAFGDPWLCLTAETRDGDLLEGCDAIRTSPPEPHPRR